MKTLSTLTWKTGKNSWKYLLILLFGVYLTPGALIGGNELRKIMYNIVLLMLVYKNQNDFFLRNPIAFSDIPVDLTGNGKREFKSSIIRFEA